MKILTNKKWTALNYDLEYFQKQLSKQKIINTHNEKELTSQINNLEVMNNALEEEMNKKSKSVKELEIVISDRDKELQKMEIKLAKKEQQRRSCAGRIGGYKTEINKQKNKVELLENDNKKLREIISNFKIEFAKIQKPKTVQQYTERSKRKR